MIVLMNLSCIFSYYMVFENFSSFFIRLYLHVKTTYDYYRSVFENLNIDRCHIAIFSIDVNYRNCFQLLYFIINSNLWKDLLSFIFSNLIYFGLISYYLTWNCLSLCCICYYLYYNMKNYYSFSLNLKYFRFN